MPILEDMGGQSFTNHLLIAMPALADPNFSDPNDATTRVKNLMYLIELSPEYVAQR